MSRRYKIFLVVAVVTFVADQLTKLWARGLPTDQRGYGIAQPVIENFFDWRISYNTGSAFGLFNDMSGARIFLTVIGFVAIGAIVWMLKQAQDDQRRFAFALGLVAGGAVGNVLDRILFGKVTDFVVWKWYEHEWPTFNIADAALCVGVALLFFDLGKDPEAAKGKAADGGMKPIFFELTLPVLGEIRFPAYMTMVTLGFVVAVWIGRRRADALGMPGDRIVDLSIVGLIAGLVGARLMSVLTDGYLMDFVHLCTAPTLVEASDRLVDVCSSDAQCGYDYLCHPETRRCYPPRDCLAALKFWQGGLTFYGGVLAAVPAGLWFARRHALGALRVADLAAPLIMLGLAFGRLGCFFNGCCWGEPTDAFFGVEFGASRSRPAGPLHPTQLYEAAAACALFVILSWRWRRHAPGDGRRFGWLLVLYPTTRMIIELFRADPRGSLGPVSTSQLVSLPLIALGMWLIARSRREIWRSHGPGRTLDPCSSAGNEPNR